MVTQTPAGPDDVRSPSEPRSAPLVDNTPVDSPPREPSAPARPIVEHPEEQNSG